MSLSEKDRLVNILVALAALSQLLGKQTLRTFRFNLADPALSSVHATTWDEMRDLRFIEVKGVRDILAGTYRLTPRGWATGMNFLKSTKISQVDHELRRLCQALKRRVKVSNRARNAVASVRYRC